MRAMCNVQRAKCNVQHATSGVCWSLGTSLVFLLW